MKKQKTNQKIIRKNTNVDRGEEGEGEGEGGKTESAAVFSVSFLSLQSKARWELYFGVVLCFFCILNYFAPTPPVGRLELLTLDLVKVLRLPRNLHLRVRKSCACHEIGTRQFARPPPQVAKVLRLPHDLHLRNSLREHAIGELCETVASLWRARGEPAL